MRDQANLVLTLPSDGSLAGIEQTIANGVPEPKEHGAAVVSQGLV